MKPSDARSSRLVTLSLIFMIFLLGYYYYDASSIADKLLDEVERLQTAWESANKTLDALRTESDGCLAHVCNIISIFYVDEPEKCVNL